MYTYAHIHGGSQQLSPWLKDMIRLCVTAFCGVLTSLDQRQGSEASGSWALGPISATWLVLTRGSIGFEIVGWHQRVRGLVFIARTKALGDFSLKVPQCMRTARAQTHAQVLGSGARSWEQSACGRCADQEHECCKQGRGQSLREITSTMHLTPSAETELGADSAHTSTDHHEDS